MPEVRYIVAQNGIMVAKSDSLAYEARSTIGSTITSGTAVTLPSSGTYSDNDLQIYLSGQRLAPILHYNYVGSLPNRTQVTFTFNLEAGDELFFRRNLS